LASCCHTETGLWDANDDDYADIERTETRERNAEKLGNKYS